MLEEGWPAPRRRLHCQCLRRYQFDLVHTGGGRHRQPANLPPEPSLARRVSIHAVPKSSALQIGPELTLPLAAASALTRTS
jgi:hypothetical protein